MRVLFRLLWVLVWTCMSAVHAASGVVVLDQHAGMQSLAGTVLYRVDESGQLGIDAVRAGSGTDGFSVLPPRTILGGDARPVWFVLRVSQATGNADWVLSTRSTNVYDMQYFGPFDATGHALQPPVLTGAIRPFSNRPLSSEVLALRMHLDQPGEYTVYVRAVSLTPRTYDFRMQDIEKFYADAQDKRIFDGICYGIMLAMLVYNLVLLMVFRDRTYALYVVSGAMALMTLASFNGHTGHYLFGSVPAVADRLNVVFPGLWISFGALFAYSFLDLERYARWTGRLVLVAAVLALGAAGAGVLGHAALAQEGNEHVSLVATLLVFAGALQSWRCGFLPARWYLGGQIALFSTVIVSVLISWGYLYAPFMEDNGLQIGVAVEVMVFAVALSSRIRLLQTMQIELRSRSERLAVAAATDPLTGVANRAGLSDRAQALLVAPHQRSLLLLDLDQFKPINDLHGHDAGDAVLVEVAARIKSQMRSDDTVARVGGDEFVVLMGMAHDRKVLEVIARRLLDSIGQPFVFGDKRLQVGGSLGIARFPENGATLSALMQAADVAMYHIKRHGRAGYAFFEDVPAQEVQSAQAWTQDAASRRGEGAV